MSEDSCYTIQEMKQLKRVIVQMEVNDLAAIKEIVMRRRMDTRLKSYMKRLMRNTEVKRAAKRRHRADNQQ